jgi:hypothetical protein
MRQGNSSVACCESESESDQDVRPRVLSTAPPVDAHAVTKSPSPGIHAPAIPSTSGSMPAAALARAALFRTRGITALKIFGLAVGGTIATPIMAIMASLVEGSAPLTLAFALCGVLALAGCVQGIRALLTDGPVPKPKGFAFLIALVPVVGGLLMTLGGVLLSLLTTADFSRGRQLRRRGKILLPRVTESVAWSMGGKDVRAGHLESKAVADQWRENGRTEHASVAAFARLTLDLMALGAPPTLVRAAQQDALDEIAHAEMCFSLASSFDGEHRGPGCFPEARYQPRTLGTRKLALAQLAVDSLIDGALHEGLSAAVVAKVANRCAIPEVRSILVKIATDEGRHAAHGWRVVEWCLAEGGEGVAQALAGAVLALPEKMRTHRPKAAEIGLWEPFGIHGSALEDDEYAKARARVSSRVDTLVKAQSAASLVAA